MTREQLMEGRYILENLWPGCQWGVGSVFPANFENFSIYPYLFRMLEWWEERNRKEMPAYVKRRPDYQSWYVGDPEVLKIKEHFKTSDGPRGLHNQSFDFFTSENGKASSYAYSGFLPATKEEYKQQP